MRKKKNIIIPIAYFNVVLILDCVPFLPLLQISDQIFKSEPDRRMQQQI